MSRTTGKPIAVSDLLAQRQGVLHELRSGASTADRTLAALRRQLPAELAAQVWGASLRQGTLTLLTGSAAWGTRLRYQAPALSAGLARELGAPIERVVVRVRSAS